MKKLMRIILIMLLLTVAGTGCITTKLRPSEVPTKSVKPVFPILVDYNNTPGSDIVVGVAPAGNKGAITNETGQIDDMLIPEIERALANKGYKVVRRHSEAMGLLKIDFRQFEFQWNAGLLSSHGTALLDIRHELISIKNNKILWNWQFEREEEFGNLPGNCISTAAGCTIIGVIPFLIYVNSVGDESTQLTENGNRTMDDYLAELESRIPPANRILRKIGE
jgi:hypothetical protein